jgi:acetyl esterase/lipase
MRGTGNLLKRNQRVNHGLIERLDPELKGPVTAMSGQPEITSIADLPTIRAAARKRAKDLKMRMQSFRGVLTEDRIIPGPAGSPGVTVRIYRPEQNSGILPALLWLRGGGYISGDLEQDNLKSKLFALKGGCVVVSVDYRLAPEYPYPAPLEDCYASLKWLTLHSDELGVDRSRIAVGGASAGSGLAAGLSLLARDRAEVAVFFQLLVYSMLNDSNIAIASNIMPETIGWTRADNLIGWRAYLGCEPGSVDIPFYAAPYRAKVLKGLPPAYIAVGDLDLFVQENIDYAQRLIEAGVSTELHVYQGGCHAFDVIAPSAGISKRFTGDMLQALKVALQD